MLTLSLIIPVYNAPDHLTTCLTAVHASLLQPDEIIVVDDASTDSTPMIARAFAVRLVSLSQNSGPATARNAGAAQASGDLLVFIDADVRVRPDTFLLMQQILDEHSEIDALIGSYDDQPTEKNFLSQYKNLSHHYFHQNGNRQASTFWGACGAIRRKIFLQHGGFSTHYRRPCIEDIELGYRLTRAGHRILLAPQVQVTHAKKWSVRGLVKTDFFDRAVPWTQLMLKDRLVQNDLNTSPQQRLSALSAIFALLSLGASAFHLPIGLGCALVFALVMVALNHRYYVFFYRKRGLAFAMRAFFPHFFYYLYSTAGFLWGILTYKSGKKSQ